MNCKVTAPQVESLRATIHAAADAMLERLLIELNEAAPTLEVLERSVLAELHTLGTVTLTALCGALAPCYAPNQVKCDCGGAADYQRQRTAQCKTLLGVVQIKRPYYLCAACHAGHCPLDRTLGFCAGSVSGGLEALLALLGTEFSYSHAAELVERLSLVQISASRCRTATIELGEQLAQQEEQMRHQVWEQGQEPPASTSPASTSPVADPLYISLDGVIVQTRETGWREQCVGAVYTTSHRRPHLPLRSQAASYVSELGSRAAAGQLLWLEAHRRGLAQAQTVVFIGDGAHWLWQTAHELFPTAIQILDWYHASSYVYKAAQSLYLSDEVGRTQWAERQLAALWESRTAEVIAALAPLAADCISAHEALSYFTANQSRMDYARYRALGLQVGSGTIESACKHVIQARLKQAGMRWSVRNACTLGKLRARLKSERWNETLALHLPHYRTYRRITPA